MLAQRKLMSVAVAAMCLIGWSFPSAAEPTSVNLITAPFGTGSYVLGNALEQISKKADAGIVVTSSETPGLAFNAKKLTGDAALRKNTAMSFTTGINYLATEGKPPFSEKLPGAMLIANYNLITVWLATFDESIRTPEDLIGKRIALGRPPQISWTIEPRLIIQHGWKLEDKISIETLGTKEAAQALLNGSVDAAVIGGYANPETGEFQPSPQTVELLAAGRKLYHVPWGADAIADTVAAGVPIIPTELKAGAIEGLTGPMPTFYDAVAWAAYPDFDEEAAYQLTKLIIENVGSFSEYHALGKLMTKGTLAFGWPRDRIHPGALRAYIEAGLLPE